VPLKPVDRLPHSLSLRTQLVLVTSVLIALAIAVTSLVAISALRAQMVHQLDEEMKASSSSLVSSVGTSQTRQDGAVGSYRVYVLDQHGNVLHSIAGADQQAENEPVLTGWDSEKVKKYHETGTTVNSRTGSNDWRIMPISLESSTNGQASSMVIALPLKQTNQVVALVGVLTFAFGLATLAAAIAMTWVIVTRTFEPLARVEQTAAKIAAGDLSQRIEDYNPSNEIGNLAISLNTMLAQIESSFNAQAKSEAKMRRFVGDASHELRTPLVSIRGYSELYRQGALPAGPGADDHGALVPQGADHGGQVLGERHQVVARRRPVRAAEATQVEGRHAVPGLRQGGDDVTPGPPALGEAVHQEGEGAGSGRGLGARQRDMETSAAGGEVAVGPGAGAIDVNRHASSLLVGAPYRRRGRPAPPTSSCTASGAPAGGVLRGWVRVVPGGDRARVGGQVFGPRRRRLSPLVLECPRGCRCVPVGAECPCPRKGRRRHDCPEPP